MHMATRTKRWTLEELHSLPDDGNKYELVRGELFVTPPPVEDHEDINSRLAEVLSPYVALNRLGRIYRPWAVIRFEGSEVEPDLFIRQPRATKKSDWDNAPTPILVAEVLSPSTRRRDQIQKRELYLDVGVSEYWIVDADSRTVRVVKPGQDDVVCDTTVIWRPAGAAEPLVIDVAGLFTPP